MQLNIILNDRESSTGKSMKTVECFKTFKIYGERFYIHHYRLSKPYLNGVEFNNQIYITSHEIGIAIKVTKALSVEKSYNKTRYFLYKIKSRTELSQAVQESKEMLQELIVKKLKGIQK